jgi:pyrroline-5-carboxylate reductase
VLAESLMAALGETLWLEDEALMDAVTAVSGSGPAYVFLLAEALAAAARAQGLDSETADRLARATVSAQGRCLKPTRVARPICAAKSPVPAAPPKPRSRC